MFSVLLLITVLFGVAAIVLLLAPPPAVRPSPVARLQDQARSEQGGQASPHGSGREYPYAG